MTDATNAQLATLTKQVELLVRTQTQGINAIQTTIMCENCGANHLTSDYRKSDTLPNNIVTNPKELVNAITIRSGVQLPEIHVKRPEKNDEQLTIEEEEVGKQDEKSKEEEYVEKEKLILNEQNKKMTFNDTALIKQFSESRIYSQIDFVIKAEEEVEIFVVVFEQCAELQSYSCEERKFKFLRINEKWCKVNRCKQNKSSKARFKVP
ncbi:Uncharacterized protein Adt_45684 [Abeliophyllum distichum]|uniref:Uncharacterized protein n=1 Tax=Abeliophyllum distichum TaxID=126358 RepID=A0ABD1PGU7_9LAMI